MSLTMSLSDLAPVRGEFRRPVYVRYAPRGRLLAGLIDGPEPLVLPAHFVRDACAQLANGAPLSRP